ncbi:hypothetical protein T492DRAFT_1149474 [Pavlovales sp. CCMP2436]|nr:hypothetical protein T492DRAFT_1149474 [Pavlovales sp. CCMP2436]
MTRLGRPQQRTETSTMEVAGLSTNAKRAGQTHIFHDDDEPPVFVPNKPPSFAGQYKDTSKILSWLPQVAGVVEVQAAHGGRRAFSSQYTQNSYLVHHEYQPKPSGASPSRTRVRQSPARASTRDVGLLPPIHGRPQAYGGKCKRRTPSATGIAGSEQLQTKWRA